MPHRTVSRRPLRPPAPVVPGGARLLLWATTGTAGAAAVMRWSLGAS
ncbi:hypothetical protein [Nocardioides fonticola]